MKKLFVFITLLLIQLTAFSQTTGKNFIDENYIEVKGKAEMEVVPDEIYLKVLISEKDTKDKVSLEEQEKAMIKELKNLGIDVEKNVSVIDLSSNFQSYWLKKTDIINGKEYQIKVKDATTAGKIFKAMENINISNMFVDHVAHSEIEKFRREVKVAAIKAAKEKASDLANAIDQQVGRALYIEEIPNYNINQNFRRAEVSNIAITGMSFSNATEPQIDFEKIKLEYEILARFKLE
ncbi:MAG: SIMPL domain-containing protein [Thalassobius sp.]|nr:SIMPL domain-containing protein [Thalassovita sp.]